MTASRAAYIGGCVGTSNVLAGKLFGIPVKGTMSHSFIMVFDEELEAFQAYAKNLPNNCVFLVDTYNTIQGVKKAIEVGLGLKKQNKRFLGIRLDSGDLAHLSIESRKLLDEAGFPDAAILASNELDETIISELKRQGACITLWGVGTNLVTAGTQPALDGVYKLSAIRDPSQEWKYKLKLSEQMTKISNPGILQIKRYSDEGGAIVDAIYDLNIGISDEATLVHLFDSTRLKVTEKKWTSKDLLVPIFSKGRCVYESPSLDSIRETTKKELSQFYIGIKRFIHPHEYVVGMEKSLYNIKVDLIKAIRKEKLKL